MKVFLGGTCAGYKWRDDLIPMLKCDYYNPIVKNWSESMGWSFCGSLNRYEEKDND